MSKHFCECSNKKTPDQDMCDECSKIKTGRFNVMKEGVKEKPRGNMTVSKRLTPENYKFGDLIWLKQGLKT